MDFDFPSPPTLLVTLGSSPGKHGSPPTTTIEVEEKAAIRVAHSSHSCATHDRLDHHTLQPVLSNSRAHSKITFPKGHGERDMMDCGLKRRGATKPPYRAPSRGDPAIFNPVFPRTGHGSPPTLLVTPGSLGTHGSPPTLLVTPGSPGSKSSFFPALPFF